MKLRLSVEEFDKGLEKLSKEFKIFAPKSFQDRGTYSDTDIVKYDVVNHFDEMVWDRKSNFSPKETILPINQVLFYFTEKEFSESKEEEKKILVFLRACDLNAVKRIDQIYLANGASKDTFYARRREKVKFVVVGCTESYRNCFCVSMGSNTVDNYDAAMNIRNNEIYLEIQDDSLAVFEGEKTDFNIDFVKENKFSIEVPENIDFMHLQSHSMWDEYDTRCIACGRCNFTCPTCTCFSMQDIYYRENQNVGERRRVWASCQVDGYTRIAGGHSFRNKQGQRMRFKTLHKIHDFKKRFGYNMCVGCGRCDDACPQYISFSEAITKMKNAMDEKNKV
ncbi:anaerobic sulfite reductase subunit AsrA [Fusobacterium gonidiaformans]|uniref:anaerobic sulfite reductase subunit AsrA n=1 Tax=Fusobacterium gonidiaformans TaxID=849 RepID=UPI0001BC6382|nr:anaerobic sulfite reductase subunit AsrA [Fusobacterium gonidiaformans]AVQ17236.1 anaerobic sulfite reductase subunit AsrA [Fusobacterium gonidiaformans ATCC 25563]EFS28002.1 sulfite reductase, subunit A [Fusobacterium gonidiaformans ATCC 25563]